MVEIDFQNEQRKIIRNLRIVSNWRFEAEAEVNFKFSNLINQADRLLNAQQQEVEALVGEQKEKTEDVIKYANESLNLVLQDLETQTKEQEKKMDELSQKFKPNKALEFIPLAPELEALHYRLIRFPKDLKTISAKYPNAREHEEVVRLLRELKHEYESLINQAEISYQNKITEIYLTHLQKVEQEHESLINEANAVYQKNMAEINFSYDTSYLDVKEISDNITVQSGQIGASWDDKRWNYWNPLKTESIHVNKAISLVRIGEFIENDRWNNQLSMPALLQVIGGRNILIKVSGEEKTLGIKAIKSIMLRLLTLVPPGKLRFVLIDPESSGHDLADFLLLKDYDEALTGKSVWTEPNDIETQLSLLNERLEFITQNIIGKYRTLENYNVSAGVMAEPYRVLVIINYPFNFSDSSIRYLSSIARNGPRCGIYTIMTADIKKIQDEQWSRSY